MAPEFVHWHAEPVEIVRHHVRGVIAQDQQAASQVTGNALDRVLERLGRFEGGCTKGCGCWHGAYLGHSLAIESA
ncbi:hypothetical protein GCM10007887_19870 [Methylobacterium haplocladii]|uniref:Uncharacterized protein n=1 Tax=Methylobacterium haplocladii TaxID=1176176 RepID=A0A512IQS5_9HYPH|nr:hypothetical protein MHA02_24370 [Methylobacterium haplocladii]GLS59321.1 hypothetical protein GCM10007887_19870 [Methylobacterium haplocladii]